jgi:5'(3')-deoxyribonucleotidase
MDRPYIILSDVDGVLEDLVTPWVLALNDKYGRDVKPSDIIEWDVTKFFPGLSKTQVFSPIHKEQFWKDLQPKEDAVEYVKKLIDGGDRVVLCTSAHPDTVPYKWQWINRHFPIIAFRDIIIASDKQRIKGDILVDDAIHNLVGGEYHGFLFSANHNKSIDTSQYVHITRVNNWSDVYHTINAMHECNWAERNGHHKIPTNVDATCLDDGGN